MQNLIVYIIGTTAAGKTKLSINLGTDNYEVISCDSMQIYKEANVMTAKATQQEQQTIKHHGIDMLELEEEGFNRAKWQAITLQTIRSIQEKGKIPVLVGGTHYYLESILFQQAEQQQLQQNEEVVDLEGLNAYDYLMKIDPLAAQKYHKNDERRIMNSIKYFKTTGQLPSTQKDHHSEECVLRSSNFIVFWPKWRNKEDLKGFITQRIRQMVQEGGQDEIINIFDKLDGKQGNKGGVLQSIGYRQFQKLYTYYKQSEQSLAEISQTQAFQQLLEEGIQSLILDTIQYTKKQVQWIRNRFLCNSNIDIIAKRLFLLEFDGLNTFKDQVIVPAQKIYTTFCQLAAIGQLELIDENTSLLDGIREYIKFNSEEQLQKFKSVQEQKQRLNWKKEMCVLCQRECNGPQEMQQHLRSRMHKIRQDKHNKQEQEAQLQVEKKKRID